MDLLFHLRQILKNMILFEFTAFMNGRVMAELLLKRAMSDCEVLIDANSVLSLISLLFVCSQGAVVEHNIELPKYATCSETLPNYDTLDFSFVKHPICTGYVTTSASFFSLSLENFSVDCAWKWMQVFWTEWDHVEEHTVIGLQRQDCPVASFLSSDVS